MNIEELTTDILSYDDYLEVRVKHEGKIYNITRKVIKPKKDNECIYLTLKKVKLNKTKE
jgi:hypothetical protein